MSLSTKTSGNRASWLAAMVLLTLFLFAALACIPPAAGAHDGPDMVGPTPIETLLICVPSSLLRGEVHSQYLQGIHEFPNGEFYLVVAAFCEAA